MKVLLDECVPERLRGYLKGHEIHSVRYAVLLTVDQGIPYQNSMTGRGIAVIVLRAPGNDIGTLKQMTEAVAGAPDYHPGRRDRRIGIFGDPR